MELVTCSISGSCIVKYGFLEENNLNLTEIKQHIFAVNFEFMIRCIPHFSRD
jgi:hypothetical protein